MFGSGDSDDELINSSQSAKEEYDIPGAPVDHPAENKKKLSLATEYPIQGSKLPTDQEVCRWIEEAEEVKATHVKKYWGETLTCPSRHQVAKQRIHLLRRAHRAGESSSPLKRDIFRIVNSEDSTSLSGEPSDEQIKAIKHKVWFEQTPNEVSAVVKLTQDIWDRVNKQERGSGQAECAGQLDMA